jgi:hypothetical protein
MRSNTTISFRKNVRSLTIFTVLIALISYGVFHWVTAIPITATYLFIIVFMYVVTLLILWLLSKSMERRLSQFANAFMLMNFGKLILFSLVIFLYAWFNRTDAASFIITFFIYYLFYTGYEIVVLLNINRQSNDR